MRIIGNAGKAREVQAVASGALSTGDTVIVNSDGTVSVVEQSSISFNVGSEVTWQTSAVDRLASAYDEASGKVVVIYRTSGDSYGIVGTVSGDSISFGSSTLLYDKTHSEIDISYDSTNSKVIVTYKDEYFYNYGAAVVGTVSGTSISFGTRTYFHSGWTNTPRSAFDSTSGKVVILFHRYDPSPTGNKAVLGTVSGTSISFESYVTNSLFTGNSSNLSFIPEQGCFLAAGSDDRAGTITVSGSSLSFGTAVTYANVASTHMPPVVTLSGTSKAMIVYEDADNSSILTAKVATVDGTSVSLGSATVIDSGANGNTNLAAVYDAQANVVMVVYTEYKNSVWGTYTVAASVSGDTITAGSINTIAASVDARRTFPVYDTVNKKVVVTLHDVSDGNDGKSWVVTNAATPTNLTSDNYIGTAATGAPDGQGAKINIKGAVDENQSGLTAGQSYYVQTDGTLGTTPADPSVFAGTAVAATKLIVKG